MARSRIQYKVSYFEQLDESFKTYKVRILTSETRRLIQAPDRTNSVLTRRCRFLSPSSSVNRLPGLRIAHCTQFLFFGLQLKRVRLTIQGHRKFISLLMSIPTSTPELSFISNGPSLTAMPM